MCAMEFDKKELLKAEEEFSRLKIVPEQNRRVTIIGGLISKYTGISLLASKGFFWRAFKEWQLENKKPATYILEAPPEEQKELFKEIIGKVTKYLEKILRRPEDKARLYKAMDEAIQYYLKNFYQKAG